MNGNPMIRKFALGSSRRFVMLTALGLAVAMAMPVSASGGRWDKPSKKGQAIAMVQDSSGRFVGFVELQQERDVVKVTAWFDSLPPGFHGFHVHTTGNCTAPAFTSAGGHLNPDGTSHPAHAGDMPVLLANADGTAEQSFETDRFTLNELFDADGSAIIVHANPDNHANIPTDRYDPDPDATTLATGDAGARIACGVIERGKRR